MDFLSKIKDNDKYNPGTRETFISARLDDWLIELSSAMHVDPSVVKPILTNLLNQTENDSDMDASSEVYRQAEYSALNGSTPQTTTNDDFIREELNGDEYKFRAFHKWPYFIR